MDCIAGSSAIQSILAVQQDWPQEGGKEGGARPPVHHRVANGIAPPVQILKP